MNTRMVARHLSKVHKEWLASIKDKELRKAVEKNTIITGGSIVSLLLGERVKDYDLYFTDKSIVKAVAEYYVREFNANREAAGHKDDRHSKPKVYEDSGRIRIRIKSAGIVGESTEESDYQYFEGTDDESGGEYVSEAMREMIAEADAIDGGLLDTYDNPAGELYRPVFLTDNAITLSGKVQLVIRFYGTPEEIHENFDYVHCTNYWLSEDKKLYLQQPALESIMTKDLKYIGSKYPVSSVIRLRRLIRKGWFANAGQILKILLQISELNLMSISVLEEQLTGVDTAYFFEMIQILKKQTKKNKTIDMTYIVSIIDRMF